MIPVNVRSINAGSTIVQRTLEGVLRKRGLIDPPSDLLALLRMVERDYNLDGLLAVNFYRANLPRSQRNGQLVTTVSGKVYPLIGNIHPASEGAHIKSYISNEAVIRIGLGLDTKEWAHSLLHELAHHLTPGMNHNVPFLLKNYELQERYNDLDFAVKRELRYLGTIAYSAATLYSMEKRNR